ncbi:CAMP factor family pore-forming toxin [Streptococcus hongkongensis]|nr:hypothetical protein NC01_00895 [Streptococcus uberis]
MTTKKIFYLTTIIAGFSVLSMQGAVTYADEIGQPPVSSVASTGDSVPELHAQLNQDANQLNQLKEAVSGTEMEASVNKAINSVDQLQTALRANPETIYDLNSIGARVEGLSDVIQAIVFSTTQLTNKVSKAHVDMGFAITKLVIRIADPFASVEAIKAQTQAIAQLEQAVLAYPDLQATDRATIYTKSKLDKAIWNTRFTRDKQVLPVKSFGVYNTLNKAITHAVGVQLNPSTTVEQVDQEVKALELALSIALQS